MSDRCRMHDDADCEKCEINNVVKLWKEPSFPVFCNCKDIFVDENDCEHCKKGGEESE